MRTLYVLSISQLSTRNRRVYSPKLPEIPSFLVSVSPSKILSMYCFYYRGLFRNKRLHCVSVNFLFCLVCSTPRRVCFRTRFLLENCSYSSPKCRQNTGIQQTKHLSIVEMMTLLAVEMRGVRYSFQQFSCSFTEWLSASFILKENSKLKLNLRYPAVCLVGNSVDPTAPFHIERIIRCWIFLKYSPLTSAHYQKRINSFK